MAGFLQDDKGNFSSTRLVFVVVVAYAMAAGWYTLLNEGSIACLALVSGLTGVAITLKFSDKSLDVRSSKKD